MGDLPDPHELPAFPTGLIADAREVEELRAVRLRLDDAGERRPWASDLGQDLSDEAEPHVGRRAADDFARFAEHGWRLVRPSQDLRDAISGGRLPGDVDQLARVFLDGEEGLFVGSGQVTAQAPAGMTRRALAALLSAEELTQTYAFQSSERTYSLAHKPDANPVDISLRLMREHHFPVAWPELLSVSTPHARPNDPHYARYQWFWRNTGQSVNNAIGTPHADVAAESAWDVTRGRGSVIALIDDGFDPAHEDLAEGVLPESGYYQHLPLGGNHFVQDSVNPTPGGLLSHGNLVAGMAAARANNRRGGCGMAPQASLRCIALPGPRSPELVARAIEYAVYPTNEPAGGVNADKSAGADVISISLSPPPGIASSQAILLSALAYATEVGRGDLGTPIYWAAPNPPGSIDLNYAYMSRRICVVASTDHKDRVPRQPLNAGAPNQGWGQRLQFLAPGQGVYNTFSANAYFSDSGCSFATPIVAGLAALALSVNPQLTWQEVRQAIRDGCDKVDTWPYQRGFNRNCGFGRVNAGRTVRRVQSDLTLRPTQ